MPKARNRFERSRQVLNWLEHEWPCGRPVILRWRSELSERDEDGKKWQAWGETVREPGSPALTIYLSKRKNQTWVETSATLIHEYAHCILWTPASVEHDCRLDHHPPWFYSCEGHILDRWNHDHGSEHASEFPVTRGKK